MTNEEHNKYIAFAFIAHGAFQLLMMLFMAAMMFLIFQIDDPSGPPPPPPAFFFFIFGFLFVFQMLFAAPSFIASYGLLKRKPWARVASIIAAALSAMNVPIGTAAAVYSLWFFCGDQWKSVYPEGAEKGRVDPLRITPGPETKWDGYTKDEEGAFVYRTRRRPIGGDNWSAT